MNFDPIFIIYVQILPQECEACNEDIIGACLLSRKKIGVISAFLEVQGTNYTHAYFTWSLYNFQERSSSSLKPKRR